MKCEDEMQEIAQLSCIRTLLVTYISDLATQIGWTASVPKKDLHLLNT